MSTVIKDWRWNGGWGKFHLYDCKDTKNGWHHMLCGRKYSTRRWAYSASPQFSPRTPKCDDCRNIEMVLELGE